MSRTILRILSVALILLFGAAGARAEFQNWSYSWGDAPTGVAATGGTQSGTVFFIMPQMGSGATPVAPIGLHATTAAENGNDQYSHAGYSFTFTITDDGANQSSAPLTVTGELNGTVTSSLVSLTNAYTNGSGSQAFDFLGHHYVVDFGFTATDASPAAWVGSLTADVQVSDIPVSKPPPGGATPEPATLVLVTLALPCAGLAGRRWRK